MVMVKATKDSEAGKMPSRELIQAMGAFNEELMKAGLLQAGEGLQPSSQGARVKFSRDGRKTLVDGPFPETKELIAGFWMIKVASKEDAVEWAKKVPFDPDVHMGGEGEIELRQVFEVEEFGEELTPELRDAEQRLRDEITKSGR
jgi:hypothetical protein